MCVLSNLLDCLPPSVRNIKKKNAFVHRIHYRACASAYYTFSALYCKWAWHNRCYYRQLQIACMSRIKMLICTDANSSGFNTLIDVVNAMYMLSVLGICIGDGHLIDRLVHSRLVLHNTQRNRVGHQQSN